MNLIVLLLIIVLLFGGLWGYSSAGWSGYGPGGIIGLLIVILLVLALMGRI